MNHIVEELKNVKVFYVATVEDDQPRVRPFSSVAEFEGWAYLCTNNTKEIYRQITANPTGPSNLYKVGDGIFEVFYLEDAVCTKYSFTADPVVIEE